MEIAALSLNYAGGAHCRLAELGPLAAAMGYPAVAQALTRFGRRTERTPELRQKMARIQKQM